MTRESKTFRSIPSATNMARKENTVEVEEAFETKFFNTHAQPNLSKAPRVTPNNILSMQCTIGNQAVQRLIQQQRPLSKPAVSSSRSQAIMPTEIFTANNMQVQPKAGLSTELSQDADGFNTLQRLTGKEALKQRGTNDSSGKIYKVVLNLVDEYNNNLTEKVQGTMQGRSNKANLLVTKLTEISVSINKYVTEHENIDRKKSVNSFKRLLVEVDLEKDNLTTVVSNKTYDNEDATTNVTWKTALAAIQDHNDDDGFSKNQRIAKIVTSLGFPVEYVKTLKLDAIMLIFDANLALATGKLGEADQALSALKLALPDTFLLIRSTLMRKNIGTLNPALAQVITNDKFKQKKGENANIGMEAMGGDDSRHFDTYTENFTINLNTSEDKVNKYAANKNHNLNLAGDIKARQAWEKDKKNVDLKKFAKLKNHEKTAITQYSQDYAQFNEPLRGNLTPGKGEEAFTPGKLEKTRNLVSALNKLPAFTGLVYRHDTDFSGFKELNQVGGTVSDMSFMSATREAYSLKKIDKIPDILIVIKSKTGRFIKPGSAYALSLEDDENEVLFKPGTQFKVVKHYKRNQNGEFPADMDQELRSALEKDKEKATIQMIFKREEV